MTWLTDCYYLLVQPSFGLERVIDRGRLSGAGLTVLVVGALLGIQAAGGLGLPVVSGLLLGVIMAAASWFVGGTLWFGTTGIVGGDGLWRQVLAGLGWCSLPLILLPVTATFGRWCGETVGGLLAFGVFTWMLVLALRAVCRAAGLSLGQGLGSLALMVALILLAPLSAGMLVLVGMAS